MATKSKNQKETKNKSVATRVRRLKSPNYKTLRLSKRIKHPAPKLPSSIELLRLSFKNLWNSKRLFFGIILIYGILTVIFVRGFGGGTNLTELKSTFQLLFQGKWSQLSTGLTLFGILLSSAGSNNSPTAGLYQSILIIIMSLVFIWSLRQVLAGKKISIKEAFYRSQYPLIPFLLVLVVIGLQLIPTIIGNALYSTIVNNGIAVTGAEKGLWGLLFAVLVLLSVYMISSSIFALYIVTLPDMTPMKALRSARGLVKHRRWPILLKVVFLPVFLIISAGLLVIPVIILLTPIAQWVFFVCTVFALAIIHSYIYTLYRKLL